jgi:hypothetical protein
LQALGITGLFVLLLLLFWIASGGKAASDAELRNANNTRTSIAMTSSYLLQPRTGSPPGNSTVLPGTSAPGATSTTLALPSATNTSLLPWLNTPLSPVAASLTPLPTQTAIARVPVSPTIISGGQKGTKAPPGSPASVTPAIARDPAEFARWYFTRVWNERDYQNLWDNYLTPGYKASVGSGLFEDYVWWWNSVERVDIHSVDVLENNGRAARVRVDLTFSMKDGRVVENQVYKYDFVYDLGRNTWMFDASS